MTEKLKERVEKKIVLGDSRTSCVKESPLKIEVRESELETKKNQHAAPGN